MKKVKKRRQKWTWLRFRKNDHEHNLLTAAQRWIHANGGTAVVLGPLEIQYSPFEAVGKYKLAVCAMGNRPEKKEKK